MTRQSLESEMERITNEYKDMSERGLSDYGLKQALLKTVDKYVEERERLARIDELEHLFDKDYITGIDIQPETIRTRLLALRQQVKGGK